jgi:hypothetical protein
MPPSHAEVQLALEKINAAWREGHPQSMQAWLHPDVAMALPGFQQTLRGRDVLIASFEEFCRNARVLEYDESELSVEVVADCAIASFRFQMLYQRGAYREHSEGRDLWVFRLEGGHWVAVWRTMLDLSATRSPVPA